MWKYVAIMAWIAAVPFAMAAQPFVFGHPPIGYHYLDSVRICALSFGPAGPIALLFGVVGIVYSARKRRP